MRWIKEMGRCKDLNFIELEWKSFDFSEKGSKISFLHINEEHTDLQKEMGDQTWLQTPPQMESVFLEQ